MIKFWVVAFAVIIYQVVKGNDWHMVYVNFHCGDYGNGRPIRKQLIAKRSVKGLDMYWVQLPNSAVKSIKGKMNGES